METKQRFNKEIQLKTVRKTKIHLTTVKEAQIRVHFEILSKLLNACGLFVFLMIMANTDCGVPKYSFLPSTGILGKPFHENLGNKNQDWKFNFELSVLTFRNPV